MLPFHVLGETFPLATGDYPPYVSDEIADTNYATEIIIKRSRHDDSTR